MLDTSYYEKTDQIIAQYSCEEKSLIPIIPVSYTHLDVYKRQL